MGTYLSPLFDYSHYLSPTIGNFSKESPVREAGLKEGDRILDINGIEPKRWDDFNERIIEFFKKLGDSKGFRVLRRIIRRNLGRFGLLKAWLFKFSNYGLGGRNIWASGKRLGLGEIWAPKRFFQERRRA